MKKVIKLTESDLTRIVKRVISEGGDSSCLLSAGFIRDSIGGPMTKRLIYKKEHNGSTYQIGMDGNNPTDKLTIIKNGKVTECSTWSCDSSSPVGIKYSGCKSDVQRPLYESDDMTGDLYYDINNLIDGKYSDIDPSDVVDVLNNISRNFKAQSYRKKHNIGPISKDEVLRNFRDSKGGSF